MFSSLSDFSTEGIYGDGSDGDVTISVDTTLSRDMYYNNLTVNASKTLIESGKIIYVKGLLTLTGTIKGVSAPNNGTAAASFSSAGVGGAVTRVTYSFGGGSAGGNGDVGDGSGLGFVGTGGSMESLAGGHGGAGAAQGNGGNTPGYAGGTATGNKLCFLPLQPLLAGRIQIQGGSGGGGGGRGDFGGAPWGGSGGGGGSGGDAVVIYARALSGSGTIDVTGGNGGAGSIAQDSGNPLDPACGGGGGGGGSGGIIIIVTDSPSNSFTISKAGGSGGAGGAGTQGGATGSSGANGDAGKLVTLLRPNLYVVIS